MGCARCSSPKPLKKSRELGVRPDSHPACLSHTSPIALSHVVTRTSLQQPICELISQHRYPLKRFFFFNGDSPDASPVTTSARRVLLVEVVSQSQVTGLHQPYGQ